MRKVATHINPSTGEPCSCGFDKFSDPVKGRTAKTAGTKLDWLRDRQDKFYKTEEGQKAFKQLEIYVNENEKIDPLAPWIWREVKKGRIQFRQPGDWSRTHLDHLADWFASNSPTRRGVDIMQLDADQALEKLKEWDEELQSKMEEAGSSENSGDIVADLENGWTIRQITTGDQAKVEGDAMGHCVGGYGDQIEAGNTKIYSLRDKKNKPHATIEISPSNNTVTQIQGKGNNSPIEEYQEMIGKWLLNMGDERPKTTRTAEIFHLDAPNSVDHLAYYLNPFEGDYIDYDYREDIVDAVNWEDYFQGGEYNGEYEFEEEIEPIERKNWKNIANDFFTDIGAQTVNDINHSTDRLLSMLADAERQRIDVSPFYEEALEAIMNHIYPSFEYRYYDPESPKSLSEQWKEFPQSAAIDVILGDRFIEDMENKISPAINPAPTGPIPGQMTTEDIAPEERLPEEVEQKDPRDPNSIDKTTNVFKRFTNRFRRNANILDEIYEYLDPEVWNDASSPRPILKPEISQWIQTFVTDALARHGYTDMDSWLSLVLTGSLTTYQYSDDSDCDISLFIDAESFPDWSRAEMIGIMMDECDEVKVPGTTHELQCYVVSNDFKREDLYKPGLRSAYDLDMNKWIVAPDKNNTHNVMREMNEASTIALENADKMEKLIRYEPLKAIQFYNQMHRRRRRDMQAGKGDFTPSNISYKMLGQRGLDKQVYALMQQYN